MVEKALEQQQEEIVIPTGEIVAENVSEDVYMARYAADFHEYVRGYVIKMSPASLRHNKISNYLMTLISTYLELNPIGDVIDAPFVMRLEEISRREPDVMVILDDNLPNLKPTFMDGPADICIEVVSPESTARDRGEKFQEFEKGGVTEYWIIDPIRNEAQFYRRNTDDIFKTITTDTQQDYTTSLLPGFRLHVPTLWQKQLPGAVATVDHVKSMLDKL